MLRGPLGAQLMTTGGQPLEGIRVVDISSSYAAPTASMYLADMGADVIKVEPPRGDDARGWGPPFLNGEAAWFLSVNRNKRSLCLDIRARRARTSFSGCWSSADVFIENLNPGKVGEARTVPGDTSGSVPAPGICAFSGFGLDGPDAALPGYDLIAQARSGMMSVTGADGIPQRVSTALSDVAAGTVAAFAVAAALVRQQRTGEGEIVDVSLLDADLAFMSPRIASYLAGDPEPQPCEARTPSWRSTSPCYRDRPIVVAIGNDRHWRRACVALGFRSWPSVRNWPPTLAVVLTARRSSAPSRTFWRQSPRLRLSSFFRTSTCRARSSTRSPRW